MPQLDLYIAISQVFWFTIFFLGFYVLIVRDILPAIARSLKLREKKVGTGSVSSLDDEGSEIMGQTATTLETSLKDVNNKTLLDINKTYIKTIGELKGRSFLIEQTIKQK